MRAPAGAVRLSPASPIRANCPPPCEPFPPGGPGVSNVALVLSSTATHSTTGKELAMVAVNSTMLPLGTPAPDFRLRSADGQMVARDDFADAPGLLVMFICN